MPDDELDLRIENARKEMELAQTFDIQIVNADFDSSYKQFKKVIEEVMKNR
jgi:guanylate kinase